MSRELTALLTQKIDEMNRTSLLGKGAAAEAVMALAVAIIADHENRLIALELALDEIADDAGVTEYVH